MDESGSNRRFFHEEGLDVVHSLAAALYAKDCDSAEHSEAVQKLSVQIAEKMEIGRERMHLLRMAALVHDIGKLAVPNAILHKPKPLTRSDWTIVRQHPRFGVEILSEAPRLNPILPLVLYHHERYDGRGYPMGKAGKEIPMLARIIGIADAYSAMTSLRSYRGPLQPDEAWKEILRGIGSHFDPSAARALAGVLNRSI